MCILRLFLGEYSRGGFDEDDMEEEPELPGEPSSILPAPTGDTLRKNFQQIQEAKVLNEEREKKESRRDKNNRQEEIPDPGPPTRAPIPPQRLIGREVTTSLEICAFSIVCIQVQNL